MNKIIHVTLLVIYLFIFYKGSHNHTILIVDMSVDETIVKSYTQNPNIHIVNLTPPLAFDQNNCSEKIYLLENYFKNEVIGVDTIELKKSAYTVHGLHILGLTSHNLNHWNIVHVGFPPTLKEHLISENYIENEIVKPMERLKKEIAKWKPSIVQVASGETERENREDLKAMNLDDEYAKVYARKIIVAWEKSWLNILDTFPTTTFVVSSGNGGTNLVTADLANRSIPSSLTRQNIIRVGSLNERRCLSSFANYPVDVALSGELVESWSACLKSPKIKLTGTSQSSALFSNYLAQKMDKGFTVQDVLSELTTKNCLKDKVKFELK